MCCLRVNNFIFSSGDNIYIVYFVKDKEKDAEDGTANFFIVKK